MCVCVCVCVGWVDSIISNEPFFVFVFAKDKKPKVSLFDDTDDASDPFGIVKQASHPMYLASQFAIQSMHLVAIVY